MSEQLQSHGCCLPGRAGEGSATSSALPGIHTLGRASAETASVEAVNLPGGTFLMGTEDPEGFAADGEGPVRAVTLRPFSISATAVTTVQFAAFVAGTGYVTEAERSGWSFVFAGFVPSVLRKISPRPEATPWW